jgi:hypothetical protein
MFGVTVLVLLSAALFRGAGQQYASITTTTMQNKRRFVEKDSLIKKNDLIVITGAGGFVVLSYNS